MGRYLDMNDTQPKRIECDVAELRVSSCAGCMCNYDSSCRHPDAPDELFGFGSLEYSPKVPPPPECPLRSKPMLLKLEE